jgi:hypothetical protein
VESARACRWALAALLAAAAVPANAAAAQVIAPRDVSAAVAVGRDGRAFVVSPSARPDSGTLSPVRRRSAARGAAFGPSRVLLGAGAGGRPVDAGVAGDGSGVIVLQRGRSVRAAAFAAGGHVGPSTLLSPRGARADFAASAVAPSGAAVVVWFRHRGAGRWRLEAATRAHGTARFGPPRPISAFVRRPCCTTVSVAIGDGGDAVAAWTSTARPAVWAALRPAGRAFRAPQRLAADAAGPLAAVVGASGAAALIYSTQHVPLRANDGLQLHRAQPGSTFGPAEHVNPHGGVTIGAAAVTDAGRVLVAWRDRLRGSTVHVSEAAPGAPLAATAELGAGVESDAFGLDADDSGRAVVAWAQRAPGAAPREQAVAAMRPTQGASFAAPGPLGRPWRTAEPGLARLVPGGGALVAWNAARYGGPAQRRSALLVTRLP